jgi:hypothetical protein
MKSLFIALLFLVPFLSFGQNPPADSANKNLVFESCDERIFIKTEIPPSVKLGAAALSDSISKYIANKNISFNKAAALFKFIVTAKGQLLEIRNDYGYTPNETVLKDALLFYSGMWVPAQQNTHIVCAYAQCEMRFENNKLTIKVL